MKTTLSALALAVALVAGIGAASAMPNTADPFDFETVFEPRN